MSTHIYKVKKNKNMTVAGCHSCHSCDLLLQISKHSLSDVLNVKMLNCIGLYEMVSLVIDN